MVSLTSVTSESIRVLSYLIDHEWAFYLRDAGFEVDYLVATIYQGWNHRKDEMPDRIRFIEKMNIPDYNLVVLPMPNVLENAVALDIFAMFRTVEESRGLPMLLVDWNAGAGKEKAESLAASLKMYPVLLDKMNPPDLGKLGKSLAVSLARSRVIKLRWSSTTHPAWDRHCQMIAKLLGGDDVAGSVVEFDCGDGPLVAFLYARFPKAKCIGVALHADERRVANHTVPDVSIAIGTIADIERKAPDYLLLTDATMIEMETRADLLGRISKKRTLISVSKQEPGIPPPWTLQMRYPDWQFTETVSHFFMVKVNA